MPLPRPSTTPPPSPSRALSSTEQQTLALLASTPAGLAFLASERKWRSAEHLSLLNRKLVDESVKRLMVFMPPRHGKSQLISEYFPAWYLGAHPSRRIILASYEADFAASWGRKARDVLTQWGWLYGVRVRDDSSAANRWDLRGKPGGMITAGVGGAMTGRGASLLVIDDPVKNWEDAQSERMRDMAYDWYQSTAYTRLTPTGRVVLVMTRWNHDDLAGRLLEDMRHGADQWDVVSLPAIAEDDDLLHRAPGVALWPEGGWDERRLGEIQRVAGEQKWASLYQQRPSPATGATYRRAWFTRRYRQVPPLLRRVLSIDSAFKTGVANDYSVIAAWGMDATNYYVLHVWRERVAFPDLVRAIKDQAAAHNPDAILIEDAASGQSVIQELQVTTRLPILAVPARGSKQSRAEATTPIWESGKVLLPEDADWVGPFIEEHVAFPNGAHDDMPDTSAQVLNYLRGGDLAYGPNIWDMQPPALLFPQAGIWDS